MLDDRTVLITGGTGSLGNALAARFLERYRPKRVVIYSREEVKQYEMRRRFARHADALRFFVGDVRDRDRLARAFDGVDYVVHAAALKQVPACEYNPIEAVKTNINGAENIIDAAIDRGVKRVVALSTDKAVNPINLYGATKLVSDRLFIAGNAYAGGKGTVFSVVRYGNVSGSRGSVIPLFRELAARGEAKLPITDRRMTRFWIYLREGVDLVLKALAHSKGGETWIAKIPAYRIVDLARAIAPRARLEEIGIREGEKIHEVLVSEGEARTTWEYSDHYVVYPPFEWWDTHRHFHEGGTRVAEEFVYSSDRVRRLGVSELRRRLADPELAGAR